MNALTSPLRSHEPRVLVSGGKDGRWSAAGRTLDDSLCTGVQSWVYAFNGDYIGHRDLVRRDLDRYDIVIMNTNHPLPPLVRLAQDRPASIKWVSLIEGSADEYFTPNTHLRTLLDLSDLVNVINRHSLPLFQALTKRKVEYIGLPYPVDGVRKLATPIHARSKRVFLCTLLLRRWNDYLVAKETGLPYYGYETGKSCEARQLLSEFIRTGSISLDKEANIKNAGTVYNDSRLAVRKFTKDLKKYFTENSDPYFWIDLDPRYTWGRFVLDAAALAMPIISTTSTYHSEMFFPQTTVAQAMDLERAIDIGKRLTRDPDFYEHVATYPAGKMEFLKAEPMKRALLAPLGLL